MDRARPADSGRADQIFERIMTLTFIMASLTLVQIGLTLTGLVIGIYVGRLSKDGEQLDQIQRLINQVNRLETFLRNHGITPPSADADH